MSRLSSLNSLRKEIFRPTLQLGNAQILHRPIVPSTASAASASPILTAIRNATKKAAGSKTSNKDSRGRRLGLKMSDGQEVKVGQIIYRQRGTRIFPGENAGLGKDHTIFALEPGFVRYYFDPFHPKRKFAGVVLNKKHRLPAPHFAPTARRFGRAEILDPEKAEQEKNHMSRKEYLAQPKLTEVKDARAVKREEIRANFSKELTGLVSDLSEDEVASAVSRLMAIRVYLSGGRTVEESRKFADRDFKIDTQIAERASKISAEDAAAQLKSYTELASKVDAAVSFDPTYQLIKSYSEEEFDALKKEKLDAIIAIYDKAPFKIPRKTREEIMSLINTPFFSLSQRAVLRRKYAKSLKPESTWKLPEGLENMSKKELEQLAEKKKQGSLFRRWNHETRKIDFVFIPNA